MSFIIVTTAAINLKIQQQKELMTYEWTLGDSELQVFAKKLPVQYIEKQRPLVKNKLASYP